MTLEEIISSRKLLICVGSGGVGKTTTSAAIALHAALSGRRTLVLTIDPARRLATALGLSQLDNEERRVPPEHLQKAGLPADAELYAAMLDTGRSLDALLSRVAKDEALQKRISENNIYKQLSHAIAGSQEYVAMERLYDIMEEGRYELVVLDTPPTKNALDFLTAPNRLVSFLDETVVQGFLKQAESNGLGGFIIQKSGNLVFKLLGVLTGGDFIKDLIDFFQAFKYLYIGFRDRADKVNKLLREEDTVFFLITSPEANVLDEAAFFHDKLLEFGMPLKALVVNRAYQIIKDCPLCSEDVETLMRQDTIRQISSQSGADEKLMKSTLEKLLNLRRVAKQFNENTRKNIDSLKNRLHKAEFMACIPLFSEEVYDLEGLARMNSYLFTSSAGECKATV